MTVYPGCSTASLLKSIWKKLLLSFSWYVEWKGDELTYHYSRILQHEEKTKDNASFLKSVFYDNKEGLLILDKKYDPNGSAPTQKIVPHKILHNGVKWIMVIMDISWLSSNSIYSTGNLSWWELQLESTGKGHQLFTVSVLIFLIILLIVPVGLPVVPAHGQAAVCSCISFLNQLPFAVMMDEIWWLKGAIVENMNLHK